MLKYQENKFQLNYLHVHFILFGEEKTAEKQFIGNRKKNKINCKMYTMKNWRFNALLTRTVYNVNCTVAANNKNHTHTNIYIHKCASAKERE